MQQLFCEMCFSDRDRKTRRRRRRRPLLSEVAEHHVAGSRDPGRQ